MKSDLFRRSQRVFPRPAIENKLVGKINFKEVEDTSPQINPVSDKGGLFSGEIARVPLDNIDYRKDEPNQKRSSFQRLIRSIEEKDLIQPVVLLKKGDRFETVAGNRRVAASHEAGKKEIAARILTENVQEMDIYRIKLMENLAREDADPVELARGVHGLLKAMRPNLELNEFINIFINSDTRPEKSEENAVTVTAIKEITGRSASTIRNWLSILKLPSEQKNQIRNRELGVSQGYILATHLEDENFRNIANRAVTEKLNKAELENLFRGSENANNTMKSCLKLLDNFEQKITPKLDQLSSGETESILERLHYLFEKTKKSKKPNQ